MTITSHVLKVSYQPRKPSLVMAIHELAHYRSPLQINHWLLKIQHKWSTFQIVFRRVGGGGERAEMKKSIMSYGPDKILNKRAQS